MEEIAAALPERTPRPVLQTLDDGGEERFAGNSVASDRVDAMDVAQRSKALSDVVRKAIAGMSRRIA